MARPHDPTRRLIKQDPKNGRYYGDFRYYGGSQREALVAPGSSGATREVDEAIAAWDERVAALKATRSAPGAQPAAAKAGSLKVDRHLPLVYAGYHIAKKRETGKVADMKEYERRLNLMVQLPPIARLKHVRQIDYVVISEVITCLNRMTITAVRSKRQGEAWAAQTKLNYLSTLSEMLTRAKRERLLPLNPVLGHEDLPSAGDETPREALEYHEAVALLKVFDELPTPKNGNFRYGKPVAALMLLGGLRRSEALKLAPQDIDFERKRIAVRKAARRRPDGKVEKKKTKNLPSVRYVKMCAQLATILREHFARFNPRGLYLFPRWEGEGAGRRETFYKDCDLTLKAAYRAAGITKGAPSYTLRHTFISHMLNVLDHDGSYVNPDEVARRVGHTDSTMVQLRYGHLLEHPVKIPGGELRFVRELIPKEILTAHAA